jgi:hypothetical protein
MPGLTFLNAIFLAGLAAAAMPIIIHLFSRRRGRRVEFSSIEFLREINRKQIKRVKLRQALVLILRIAAVCLLALAMGRPALRGGAFASRGLASSAECILLDASYSMMAEPVEGQPLFERARARAQEVVDLMGREDEAFLVLVADSPRPQFEGAVSDRGRLRQEIRGAEATLRGTDFRRSLRRAALMLEESKKMNKEIYLISDLQRSGWGSADGERVDIPEDIRVYCVGVSDGVPNIGVRDVELLRGLSPGQGRRVRTTVANYTGEPLGELPVKIALEGAEVGEGFVNIGEGRLGAVTVPLGDEAGAWGSAYLSRDALPADDRRYFAAPSAVKVEVLVVDGGLQEGAESGDAEFVRLALAPGGPAESPFKPTVIGSSDLDGVDLSSYDAVILCNVGRVSESSVSALKSLVASGGGLVIFLGDRVDARYYNEHVLPGLIPATILGTKGTVGPEEGYASLLLEAAGHPIFEGFPAAAGQKLTRAKFNKVAQLKVEEGARVLANFSDGLPAMVSSEGAILFASSCDGRWNNLPSSGGFLPLLHQMVAFAARGELRARSDYRIGSPIEALVGPEWAGKEIFHVTPSGLLSPVTPRDVGNRMQLRVEDPTEAGVHMFISGRDTLAVFAVNVDPAESDLAPATSEELEHFIAPGQLRIFQSDQTLARQVAEARVGREVWRLGVLGVIVLLGAELFVGRGRKMEGSQ